MSEYAVMPLADYDAACDKVREKVGAQTVLFEETDFGYLRSAPFSVVAGKTYTVRLNLTDATLFQDVVISVADWNLDQPPWNGGFSNPFVFEVASDNTYCAFFGTYNGLTINDILSATLECDGEIVADFVEPLKIKSGELADKVDKVYAAGQKAATVTVDQTFNPESTNAQSGIAVARGINSSSRLNIWDGSIAKSFCSGKGSAAKPYLISSGEELALMVNTFGAGHHYRITSDIYLNDIYNSEWSHEWFCCEDVPNAKYMYTNRSGTKGTFDGYIDGMGYTIFGLYHSGFKNGAYVHSVGFIPTMGNGEIKNLRIDYSLINAGNRSAGFIGMTGREAYANGKIVIDGCTVGENVKINVFVGDGAAAGFIGYSTVGNDVDIRNSCCLAENVGGFGDKEYLKYNGFIGESWKSPYALKNCYSVIQPINSGGMSERVSSLPISEAYVNVYSATQRSYQLYEDGTFTKVSKTKMIGMNALDHMPGLEDGFVNTSRFPETKANLPTNAIELLTNLKHALEGIHISVKTYGLQGEIYAEPNTIYMLSSLNAEGCSHDAPNGSIYKQKFIMVIVGQLEGSTARCYAIELGSTSVLGVDIPKFGNWPLDAITANYRMRMTYDAGSTIIIIRNPTTEERGET